MIFLQWVDPAKGDRQAVPGVDRGNQEGQGGGLLLVELPSQRFIVCVRRARLGNSRHRLGPGQSRPLPLGVEGRLAPGAQEIEAFFALPLLTRFADRKSTRLNSSHVASSYAVFCLKKK